MHILILFFAECTYHYVLCAVFCHEMAEMLFDYLHAGKCMLFGRPLNLSKICFPDGPSRRSVKKR